MTAQQQLGAGAFLHQLLSLPEVYYGARIAPDGTWVAFEWYRIHENLDVFAVPADGSASPVALTHTHEITRLASWTADSRAVIVSEDHDGDERVRLFRIAIDHPGEMQPLTEDHPPYFIRGGHLHPDGRTLFYGANYDFTTDRVIEPTWVYRHDLGSGERVAIARPVKPAWAIPSLNWPGTHLIYTRQDRHSAGRQIYLVDAEGREDREILHFGDQVKVWAQWFPDGEHILVLSDSRDGCPQEHYSLGVYHWPSDEMRWLLDDSSRNIEEARVSPDGLIIVDELREARRVPSFLDPATGVEMPFPRWPGNLQPLGRTADGTWVARCYSATAPVELVRFTFDASPPLHGRERAERVDPASLTRVWEHTDLEPAHLTPAEDFRWRSEDGLEIQGWLYRAQPNPRRAIVFIHGGPTWHSEDRVNAQLQYFVSLGFNVLDVNYRGSTGFGQRFRELIKEDGWGGHEQADIATGAEALIRAGLADPGRIGVTGTSYGGYSSWFLITHYPPEVIAAAAPICGMTDLVVDYNTTRPDLRPYSEEMMGGSPDESPERYYERSPINSIPSIQGRLLIVQGAQDPNVTSENVRLVAQRLDASHIPYELLVFEDEGHGISKPINQERLYMRLAAFFDEALG